MLHLVGLPEIRNPETMASGLFFSPSLSACVATLLELPAPPHLWEEDGTDWFLKLDTWAHSQRLQALNFTDSFHLRGLHLRFFAVAGTETRWADGSLGYKIEAAIFQGEDLVYCPSPVEPENLTLVSMRVVFIPYDPAPQRLSYQQ